MAEQKVEQQQTDAARRRSPNFSYASVRDCVRYLTNLEAQVHQGKVPILIAFDHMGLNRGSSSTDRIRASMSNYKLTKEEVVGKEKYLRLTDLAYQIIIDAREDKRLARVREAALNDPMTKKVWEAEWKRGLPNDDAIIISVLRSDYKFQEESAKRFATVLKDNYQFCQLATYYEPPAGDSGEVKDPPAGASGGILPPMNNPPKPPETPEGTKQFPIPLDDGRFAYIDLPLSVTESDAEYIPDYVSLILKKIKRSSKNDDQKR
jgi:hypothetical protein